MERKPKEVEMKNACNFPSLHHNNRFECNAECTAEPDRMQTVGDDFSGYGALWLSRWSKNVQISIFDGANFTNGGERASGALYS